MKTMVGVVDTPTTATTTTATTAALYDIDVQILQKYTGEGRLRRLVWIISNQNNYYNNNDKSFSTVQQDQHGILLQTAYETAINQCMISNNTERYKEIFQYYQKYQNTIVSTSTGTTVDTSTSASTTSTTINTTGSTGSTTDNNNNTTTSNNINSSNNGLLLVHYNEQWYIESIQQNKNNYNIIHVRLQTAQSHLNKEAIRICYIAIAEYSYNIGTIHESLHCTIRSKDYCTTKQQTIYILLQILFYSLLCNNYTSVLEYIPRLETMIATLSSSTTATTTTTSTSAEAGGSLSSSNTGGDGGGSENTGTSNSTTSTTINTKLIQNCINVASGLEKLYNCDYKIAAEKFRLVALSGYNHTNKKSNNNTNNNNPYNNNSLITTTGSSDNSNISGTTTSISMNDPIIWDTIIVSPEEIALYAGILSLAYEDNRLHILNLAENVEALELIPIVKEILIQFVRYNNYKQSYLLLEQYIIPLLQYDIYLSNHLHSIVSTIRIKAIEQYWIPYQIISLSTMASELGSSIIRPTAETITTTTTTTTTKQESSSSSSSSISRLLSSSSSSLSTPTNDDDMLLIQKLQQLMISNRSKLGYDTRIDMVNKTLVRDDEMKRYYTTVSKLNTVTNRTINDTYSMLVRIGCNEGNPTSGNTNNNSSNNNNNMTVSKRVVSVNSSNWMYNYRPNVDTSDTNIIDDNDYINDNVQISGGNNNDAFYNKNNNNNKKNINSRNFNNNNNYNNNSMYEEGDDDDIVMNYHNLVDTIDEDYNGMNDNNVNNFYARENDDHENVTMDNYDDDHHDNDRNIIMQSQQNPEDTY